MRRKVTIYTNMDEQCGNYQYALDLAHWLQPHFDMALSPSTQMDCDVVIVNWHPARVVITVPLVQAWQAEGKKVILELQNSFDWRHEVGPNDILFVCDAVVAHEPMDSNAPIHYIPVGIMEVPLTGRGDERAVGTAGFQFPWKRPDVVVNIAKRLNIKARIVCPPYPGVIDQGLLERQWSAQCDLQMFKQWLPAADVIDILSYNKFNVFWFQSQDQHDQFGQTGSARMGFAAGRPVIISRHRKFRTVLDYTDDLYIADTEEDVYRMAEEILTAPEKARVPKRLLEEMGWSKTGQKYKELIDSL